MGERTCETKTLVESQTVTAAGSCTGLLTNHWYEGALLIRVSAISGTLPALNLIGWITDEDQDVWYRHQHFRKAYQLRAAHATDEGEAYVITGLGHKFRLTWTVDGTTPSITFEVKMHLKG